MTYGMLWALIGLGYVWMGLNLYKIIIEIRMAHRWQAGIGMPISKAESSGIELPQA